MNRTNLAFNALGDDGIHFQGTVEKTKMFERNDFCIIAPKTKSIPVSHNILHIMSEFSLLNVILSLFCMATVYRLMQMVQKRLLSNMTQMATFEPSQINWIEALSKHYQSFFGDSITKVPTSQTLRNLFIGWCIFSFLITNIFTAKLISSLVIPRFPTDIDTLNELGASDIKLIYPDIYEDTLSAFFNRDQYTHRIFKGDLVVVPIKEIENMIANNKNNAYIMPNYKISYTAKKYFDKNTGKSFYHPVKECLFHIPRIYIIEKGSPYLQYVNDILSRLNEMGFLVHWLDETDFLHSLEGDIVEEESLEDIDDSQLQVVLKFEHLQISFYFLAIGLTLAALAFAMEWCWYCKDKIKNYISKLKIFKKSDKK